MALIQTDITRETRRRLTWAAQRGAPGGFARAAVVGCFGVMALAFALPGATPAAIAISVLFYAVSARLAGRSLRRAYPHDRLGLCNYVTLTRLVLTCALLAPFLASSAPSWAFFTVAAVALALDGVDGWLARRQGLVSTFGAQFDVEVDSLLALLLAFNAALNTEIGWAAALLGLPRYAFAGASLALPWLSRALPERFSRKVVCVLQLATLIALQAPLVPPQVAMLFVPMVAVALIWSFAVDIFWLWRSRA